MRDRDYIFNDRRVFGDTAVHGVSARVRSAYVALGETELSGLCAGVRGELSFVVYFQRGTVLGSFAFRYVFRTAPARQRVATENKNKPLDRLRGQSALVRRNDVYYLAVCVRYDDERSVFEQFQRFLDHTRRRLGVFRFVRLSYV